MDARHLKYHAIWIRKCTHKPPRACKNIWIRGRQWEEEGIWFMVSSDSSTARTKKKKKKEWLNSKDDTKVGIKCKEKIAKEFAIKLFTSQAAVFTSQGKTNFDEINWTTRTSFYSTTSLWLYKKNARGKWQELSRKAKIQLKWLWNALFLCQIYSSYSVLLRYVLTLCFLSFKHWKDNQEKRNSTKFV